MRVDEKQQTAFRLPVSLLQRLDQYADRMRFEHPGMSVTRADVVRMLLTRALDDLDERAPAGKSGLRAKR